jgi:valyl-tRNA synthetase
MPHLTQELWQAIGATEAEPSLGKARFPVADPALIDPDAEAEIAQVFEWHSRRFATCARR